MDGGNGNKAGTSRSFWQAVISDTGDELRPDAAEVKEPLPTSTGTVVIGCGLTGLSCALALARGECVDTSNIVVVDARDICDGATARNGGHAYPDIGEGDDDTDAYAAIEAHDKVEVRKFIESELSADEIALIGLTETGGLDLCFDLEKEVFYKAYARNTGLAFLGPNELRKRGIAGAVCAVETPTAAQFCPAALVLSMYKLCLELGVSIQLRTRVIAVEGGGVVGEWIVRLDDGRVVRCANVVHATNGLGLELLPPRLRKKVQPVKGQCLAAKMPTRTASQSLIYDNDDKYLIQRSDDNVVVFGGCRHKARGQGNLGDLDEAVETSVSDSLKKELEELFPKKSYTVTHEWAGTMCFSEDGHPLVGAIRELPGQYLSVGYTGQGMVRSWSCGKYLAEKILKRKVLTCPEIETLFSPDRFG